MNAVQSQAQEQEHQRVIIPSQYKSVLSPRDTIMAITQVKNIFEKALSEQLNLIKVPAPLFVAKASGLNDNLNGVEGPVTFRSNDVNCDTDIEIVHSLAKWKRWSLGRYGMKRGEGLYTNMLAIRKDELLSNVHSIYVDQWDWEKVIAKEERTTEYLKAVVEAIYDAFKLTEDQMVGEYPQLGKLLPEKIQFMTTQELEDRYPKLSCKEREHAICKEHGAVFLMEIGGTMKSGMKHDGRAPDYDDWKLNGDILFWYPPLNRSLELSSMGIRVDKTALLSQLKTCGCEGRATLDFHQNLLNETLPLSIGGGIGQSRTAMYFLRKVHIGEVQSSMWSKEVVDTCGKNGVELL